MIANRIIPSSGLSVFFNLKISMPMVMLIISSLAMGSPGMAHSGVHNCKLPDSRFVSCYPVSRVDITPCSCCDAPILALQETSAENSYSCNLDHKRIKLLIEYGPFVFNDVSTLTKQPVLIIISYMDFLLKTIAPSTFQNISSLEEIFIDGISIDSVSNLSFVGLPNLKNFSLTNTMITSLPIRMFEDVPRLQHFNLSHNEIVTIRPDTFKNMNSLFVLCLTHNRISCLTQTSFFGLDNLIFLDLSHNKLKYLPSWLFTALWNVEEIKLDSNYIVMLNKRTFESLNNLRRLSLRFNFITSLPLTLFYGAQSIYHLDVSYNDLVYVSLGPILNNFKQQNSSLQLDGNHLECCHLDWVSDLMSTTRSVSVKNSLYNLTCNSQSLTTTKVYSFNVSETELSNQCLSKVICPNCTDYLNDEDITNSAKYTTPILNRHYRRLNICSEIVEVNYNYSNKSNNENTSLSKSVSIFRESQVNTLSWASPMLLLPIFILYI